MHHRYDTYYVYIDSDT